MLSMFCEPASRLLARSVWCSREGLLLWVKMWKTIHCRRFLMGVTREINLFKSPRTCYLAYWKVTVQWKCTFIEKFPTSPALSMTLSELYCRLPEAVSRSLEQATGVCWSSEAGSICPRWAQLMLLHWYPSEILGGSSSCSAASGVRAFFGLALLLSGLPEIGSGLDFMGLIKWENINKPRRIADDIFYL